MNDPPETPPPRPEVGSLATPKAPEASGARTHAIRRFAIPTAVAAGALLFLGLLVFGLRAQVSNGAIDDSLSRGRAALAPAFDLRVIQRGRLGSMLTSTLGATLGRPHVSLRALRGVPIVLNIWASWCDPCRQEAPLLERTWRTVGRPRGVLLLGLDQQDAIGDATAFMRQYAVDYPNLHDAGNDVPRNYGATGVPETYFIDARGDVVDHVIGIASAQQLRAGILAARAGRPLGVRSGGARRPSR